MNMSKFRTWSFEASCSLFLVVCGLALIILCNVSSEIVYKIDPKTTTKSLIAGYTLHNTQEITNGVDSSSNTEIIKEVIFWNDESLTDRVLVRRVREVNQAENVDNNSSTVKPDNVIRLHGPTMKDLYEPGFLGFSDKLCPKNGSLIKVAIIVSSAPDHFKQRAAIRKTWGRRRKNPFLVIFGFMVGMGEDYDVVEQVAKESVEFNDMIINFNNDTLENRPLKTMSILEWTTNVCPKAKFILKVDDDMVVNVPNLLRFVDRRTMNRKVIYGYLRLQHKPDRNPKSKKFVSKTSYPRPHFPEYIEGGAYLMTSDVPRLLHKAAFNQPFFSLEDCFFTGIVAGRLDIRRIAAHGFYGLKSAKDPMQEPYSVIAYHKNGYKKYL